MRNLHSARSIGEKVIALLIVIGHLLERDAAEHVQRDRRLHALREAIRKSVSIKSKAHALRGFVQQAEALILGRAVKRWNEPNQPRRRGRGRGRGRKRSTGAGDAARLPDAHDWPTAVLS